MRETKTRSEQRSTGARRMNNNIQAIRDIEADFLLRVLDGLSSDGGGSGTWAGLKGILRIIEKRYREGNSGVEDSDGVALAQVKHDAIVKMQQSSNAVVTTNCRCNSLSDHDAFAYKYAKSLLTQAKEQDA